MSREPLVCLTRWRAFVLVVAVVLLFQVVESRIVQVVIVSRHGDRAPTVNTFNNPNVGQMWPLGLGQLTARGMNQTYNLGRILRARYIDVENVTSGTYNQTELYFRSSGLDRTLMSAQCVELGLFPPGTGPDNALPDNIQPSAITSVSSVGPMDELLLRPNDACPSFNDMTNGQYSSDDFLVQVSKYGDLFKTLSAATNITVDTSNLDSVRDTLLCERAHGFNNYPLVTDSVFAQMTSLNNWLNGRIYSFSNIQNLLGGLFLAELLAQQQRAVSGSSDAKKLLHYSAHDTTLSSIFAALSLSDTYEELREKPQYAAALVFELHVDEQQAYSVGVRYNFGLGNTTFAPYAVPGCQLLPPSNASLCVWSSFSSILQAQSMSTDDFCKQCSNNFSDQCVVFNARYQFSSTIVFIIIIGSLLGVASIYIGYLLWERRQDNAKLADEQHLNRHGTLTDEPARLTAATYSSLDDESAGML